MPALLASVLAAGVLVAVPAPTTARPAGPTTAWHPASGPVPTPALAPGSRSAPVDDRLLERIRRLPRVASVREGSPRAGLRLYRIGFRQPADHTRPGGPAFVQRVSLLHRGTDRPTVLSTAGYDLGRVGTGSEVRALLDANEVRVEHRYFTPSRPADPQWAAQLTIRQAAADHHRVVQSLKRLYDARWISTGASKSGMAATYHRRFYPGDVAATVAYVAPNDVVDADDSYDDFLAQVGTRACREAVVAVQRRALGPDREWLLERTLEEARARGFTWDVVGDPEKAWEAAVVDASFSFWQQQRRRDCADVPGADRSREAVWQWFETVIPLTYYADQPLRRYVPYYYQALAQLGAPDPYEARIADLVRHPGASAPRTFVPASTGPVSYDGGVAMADVDGWVRIYARRIVFLYGGDDPWTAEPFECGATGRERGCHRYVVARQNHFVQLADLPRPDRRAVTARLERWAGLRR